MRAIQIASVGDPLEVTKLVDMAEPKPPVAGEVLLAMAFAPVNVNDLLMISGRLPTKPAAPAVVGNEGVGTVLAVGPGVTSVNVGDRAIAPLYSGTWREKMIVPAEGLFPLSRDADLQQLAMIRINPLTAALMLQEYVDLQPGDWVVQNAANSGVGRAAIAVAKAHGQRTINLVRRAELAAELRDAGGDLVLVDEPGAAEKAAQQVGDGKVRLALDGVSGAATARLADFLSPGGTLVGYAMMSGEIPAPGDLRPIMSKGLTLASFYMGVPRFASKIAPLLPHAARMVASGAIRVPVAATYRLSQITDALAHVQRGGKVMLDIANA